MNKKINILYVTHLSERIGGGEIVLYNLISGLNKEKYQPILACPQEGVLSYMCQKKGAEIYPVIVRKQPFMKITNPIRLILSIIEVASSIRNLYNLIKVKDIKLVHLNSTVAAIYGSLAAKWAKVPSITHLHNVFQKKRLDELLLSIYQWINTKYLTSYSIAVSESVKETVKHLTSNIEVVYNGVDISKFTPEISREGFRKRYQIPLNISVVGTIGAVVKRKGIRVFVEAAVDILKVVPNVKFIIVGGALTQEEGTYRDKIEELVIKLNLQEKIIFTGFIENVPEAIAAMDILVFPSIEPEGFPLGIIEALACGKPVIATDINAHLEIIQHGINGLLIEINNKTALSKAVITLLTDKEKAKEMGRQGRKIVEEKFTIQKNIAAIEKIYEKLIKGS